MKKVIKSIYNFLPFKKAVFTALKTVWCPPKSLYKHLHFKDVFTVAIDDKRKFKIHHFGFRIENEIFWEGFAGAWEKESLRLWIELCEESQTILDIGANTGIYALVAKAINPASKVYAFEPHPMFFKMLQQNVSLNNYDVVCLQKAVSNENSEIVIGDFSGEIPVIKVEGTTLDRFIETNAIKKIDLIKIDVETFEPQVMEGFTTYLSRFKPTILIEILNNEVAESINGFVKAIGYLYFNIDENGQVRQTNRIEKSDYYNYLLCSPEIAQKLGLINT